MTTKINIGDRAKDKVTGFAGVCVARTDFLNGCTRIGLQSEKLKDGLPTDAQWFDEPQLTLIKPGVVSSAARETGGPLPFVPKRAANCG